eukprot:TRINITY_DN534_c0_g1_i1.p1 TRINITY_DN534_c0_g1~~TRINITY_DN534_c0_g1_i1.p1  ORF type:complete len:419 (+),score=125.95 TRINITY_DN534_c0_g1_i1:722-1978(+)
MAGKFGLPYLELIDENDHEGMQVLFKTCVRMFRVDIGELDAKFEIGLIGKTTAMVTDTLVEIHSKVKPALTAITLTTDVLQLMALNFSVDSIPWKESVMQEVFPIFLFKFDIPFQDFLTVLWMVLVWIFVGVLPLIPVGDGHCLFQWIESKLPTMEIQQERMAFTDVPLANEDAAFEQETIEVEKMPIGLRLLKYCRVVLMIVTWSCARILFLPLFRVMLTTVDCTNTANGLVLDRDPSVLCWQGDHLAEGIFCLIGMVVLLFVAIRLLAVQGLIQLTYKDENEEFLWFSTRLDNINLRGMTTFSKCSLVYDRVMIVTKIVVVLVSVLFTSIGILLVIVFTVCSIALLAAIVRDWPFFGEWVNSALGAGLSSVLWTNILALVVVIVNDSTQDAPVIVWVVGVVVVFLLTVAVMQKVQN